MGRCSGSVFILDHVTNFGDIEDQGPFTAINYYWTNHALDTGCGNGTTPCFLVTAGKGAPLYESFPGATNAWNEFP